MMLMFASSFRDAAAAAARGGGTAASAVGLPAVAAAAALGAHVAGVGADLAAGSSKHGQRAGLGVHLNKKRENKNEGPKS